MPLHDLKPTYLEPDETTQCIECSLPIGPWLNDYGVCTYRRISGDYMTLYYHQRRCYEQHVNHAYHNASGGLQRCTVEKVPNAIT